jgi:hypothetical protein
MKLKNERALPGHAYVPTEVIFAWPWPSNRFLSIFRFFQPLMQILFFSAWTHRQCCDSRALGACCLLRDHWAIDQKPLECSTNGKFKFLTEFDDIDLFDILQVALIYGGALIMLFTVSTCFHCSFYCDRHK